MADVEINHGKPTAQVDYQPAVTDDLKELAKVDAVMRFFAYKHLPDRLQPASKPFCDLAVLIVQTIPRNAERTVSLRKLVEAKDAAVRAALPE